MTDTYVSALVATYPEISEVWLIGSRAEGNARTDSDWDYIVFGNQQILNSLRQRKQFNAPEVDLLVVHDGNRFTKPWRDGTRIKAGSLADWHWRRTSPTEATYRATKFRDETDFDRNISEGRGLRVWPRSQ
ncbi:MAG TPA: nucleotidyltransferase domain-containing protein [Stellaceae bacterium]|nr:nucleotidyltransferase domain-containing protein [Stellaceae bacterium]